MVSQLKRINKFSKRKPYTQERKDKQRSILERARQTKQNKTSSRVIPKSYNDRITLLEKGTNQNDSIMDSEVNEELEDIQITSDYHNSIINDTQDEIEKIKAENTELSERVDELESTVDANDDMMTSIDNELQALKNDSRNDKIQINRMDIQIKEMKKLVNILYDDLENQLALESDSD
tara:strand:- start:917 stop:1450 length:534 start_codon:yes stop_codon:yes gene_type:complete